MPCFRPLEAWRSRLRGRSGKQLITFDRRQSFGLSLQLPCGQCIGCRLERSRQWAMRCVHEASLHDENCFLTLTYDDEHVPTDGSLNKSHFQLFMKRLRSRFSECRIRYYHCGEYGGLYRRPHYHALLFGFDFADKQLFKVVAENRLYVSATLGACWKLGFSSIGAVTFESAAYVARYVMKKVTGDAAVEHYVGCDEVTGELVELLPEYTTMSRRPGIGRDWFDRFSSDVYPSDEVVLRGRSMRPPRYYDSILDISDPHELERLKFLRKRQAAKHEVDCTPERLAVREFCKTVEVSRLLRSVENES